MTPAPTPGPIRSRAGRRRRLWWTALAILLGISWFGWNAVTYAASLRLFIVPSGSMAPTVVAGDRIFVETERRSAPKRGEIWLFGVPGPANHIKRVVGLPGDSIEVAGGRVLIDGRALDEPYLAGPMNYVVPPVRLKTGQYFMLGDNRNASNDSHLSGPVPEDRLIGRVEFRPWPPGRIGALK